MMMMMMMMMMDVPDPMLPGNQDSFIQPMTTFSLFGSPFGVIFSQTTVEH
jgi:hypothetical protein